MRLSRRLLLLLALLALVGTALALVGSRWATARARAAADRSAAALAQSHVGLLASELQKFRLLPLVLAEYPDVADALRGGGDAGARLDRTLELLAERTDAAVLYAIDARGRTVAASNWRLPTSFVGQNYGFRPYFTDAMRRGASELFALGTVSGRPGLYLARRIDAGGRALGVVVVKVEFDAVEADWRRSAGISVVTDPHGVVLVTSVPAWRFTATDALDAATRAAARQTLQFGTAPLTRAPVRLDCPEAVIGGGLGPERYRVASVAAPLAGGRLLHLSPLGPPLAAARTQALLWALGTLLVIGAGSALLLRGAEKRRLETRARAALEAEVVRRTAELRAESAERLAADQRYRAAREELAQANRLGSLGQITAGVAHEINQPLAAIRTFAENAAEFLRRGAPGEVGANLSHIVALTDRVGAITGELRAFARRKAPASGRTPIGAAIDGLLLLLGERARGVLAIDVPDAVRGVEVAGDRIRLEQILVNLVQNALEAVTGQPDARATVTAEPADGLILVRVTDNGPGIAPALADTLFTPFATAKPGGLGLGLAIARDIARDLGGELVLEGGAPTRFLLTLRRA